MARWIADDDVEGTAIPFTPDPFPKGQEILDKWEKTGLLEKLETDRQKMRCALILEEAAKFMKDNDWLLSELAKRMFLPLVRRLFPHDTLKPFTINFRQMSRFLNVLPFTGSGEKMMIDEIEGLYRIDTEVEFCQRCEDFIVNEYDMNLIDLTTGIKTK